MFFFSATESNDKVSYYIIYCCYSFCVNNGDAFEGHVRVFRCSMYVFRHAGINITFLVILLQIIANNFSPSQSSLTVYSCSIVSFKCIISFLLKYFTPKSSTHRKKSVFLSLCFQNLDVLAKRIYPVALKKYREFHLH